MESLWPSSVVCKAALPHVFGFTNRVCSDAVCNPPDHKPLDRKRSIAHYTPAGARRLAHDGEGLQAMAFVSDYDHDVFVSYAHLDNQGETAWVSTLVRHLETDLRQRLGTQDLRIWIDEHLDGNRPLTPEIMRSIQRSATLLIVM